MVWLAVHSSTLPDISLMIHYRRNKHTHITTVHCTTVHCTTLQLYCRAAPTATLRTLHYITLHFLRTYIITLHYISVQYISLHLCMHTNIHTCRHYITLHYVNTYMHARVTASHHVTFLYNEVHCTTYIHAYIQTART